MWRHLTRGVGHWTGQGLVEASTGRGWAGVWPRGWGEVGLAQAVGVSGAVGV